MGSQIVFIGLIGLIAALALCTFFILFGYRIVKRLFFSASSETRYNSSHLVFKIIWPRKIVLVIAALLFVVWGAIELSAFIESASVASGVVSNIIKWPALTYDWLGLNMLKSYAGSFMIVLFEGLFLLNFYLLALILYWLGRGVKTLFKR